MDNSKGKKSIVEMLNGTILYFVDNTYTMSIERTPGQPPSEDLIVFTHTASGQVSFQALRKNIAYIRMNIPRSKNDNTEEVNNHE